MTPSPKPWLAAYLYYAEPWETFLTQAVKPFVETIFGQKLAEQFFFIRYWERGPHIRLRFKGDHHTLEHKVKPALESFFAGYFETNPSQRSEPDRVKTLPVKQGWFPNNSIQFMPYEPEIERYGGPAGILIAEKQFEISSRAVLHLLNVSKQWDYERALGAAIQLHLGFAWALGMDLAEAKQFYTRIFDGWFSRAYGFAPHMPTEEAQRRRQITLQAFAENFEQQQEMLVGYHQTLWEAFSGGVEFEQAWLNDWLAGMITIRRELGAAQREGRLIFPEGFKPNPTLDVPPAHQQLWSILSSYVHMTNNRLGILNQDEAYLGYLIQRSLGQLVAAQPIRKKAYYG
ncbi:MAG: hypothetical protein GWN55_09740 [Phycisphaerae bacterium]|nr:hypothetical protein [Phycisphaerae bacterium]NIV01587.1 hypothetical protein [Phycisphaerae bacterium]NIV69416.1 hypothetical protein [Phycisphaerae bacterium]NIW20434.1 hypothetical protein [candidate division KSB1 bacterium]NIX32565.1 hypothetical protein [Phycisphaerae bacterium]